MQMSFNTAVTLLVAARARFGIAAGRRELRGGCHGYESFTVAKASQFISFEPPPCIALVMRLSCLLQALPRDLPWIDIDDPWEMQGRFRHAYHSCGGHRSITAAQAGETAGNYPSATGVTRGFAVAKAAQLIAFPAIADHVYADPPFALVATSSSKLVVAFASMTPATCKVTSEQYHRLIALESAPFGHEYRKCKLFAGVGLPTFAIDLIGNHVRAAVRKDVR